MTRLVSILAFGIIVASYGCGKLSLPQKPVLIVDRESLGFGQEFGSCTKIAFEADGGISSASPQDSIKLENGGLEDLVISSANYSGDSAFKANGPPKTTLKSKEFTFIQVIFTPTAEKVYNGSIEVDSNAEVTDGGGPKKTLKVSGRGCAVSSDGG